MLLTSCHAALLPRPPASQALQFRLREDLKAAGGDLASFDQLKEASGGWQYGQW